MANFDYYNSIKRKSYLRKNAFFPIFVFFIIIATVGVLMSVYLKFTQFYGLGQIILAISLTIIAFAFMVRFADSGSSKDDNIAEKLSSEMIELFEITINCASRDNISEITAELCFDSFSKTNFGRMVFMRLGLFFPQDRNKKNINNIQPQFSQELINLLQNINTSNTIEIDSFINSAVANSVSIQKYLSDYKLTKEDVYKVLNWAIEIKRSAIAPHFWEKRSQLAGIGQDWSYGYTPILSVYSIDISRYFDNPNFQIDVFGHRNKIDEIQAVLVRNAKNNCILVGEPGVGKKTIVHALAGKLATGDCIDKLKFKRIREIDVGRVLAGADSAELNRRVELIFSESISSGNIILYIDNFQSLIYGNIDVSQVLIPYLQNSKLQVIASVAEKEYHEEIRLNSAISGAFEKIEINQPDKDTTLSIILEHVGIEEYRNNVFFPLPALKKIVELSDRYVHEIPNPEKSIRLLSEAAVNFAAGKIKVVKPEDIEELVSRKTNIPIGEVKSQERDRLLDLESFLHQKIVGQDEAIKALSDTLRRVRAGLTSGRRPAGVFLFLGPTGVGKTETAKTLAETYFGSEKRMIRLDMSEYQTPDTISRLIGTTENPSGVLTNAVLEDPFSLILLDEIEKADKNILNIFLQVFEDGRLTDPAGRVSDFTNTIIIATSNAGAQFIQNKINLHETDTLKDDLLKELQIKNIFSPELLNRFDSVIVYKSLTGQELTSVANLMINDLNKTLAQKRIRVEVSPEALAKLVELGYDPKYGARPMRRVITEKIENLLAKRMISGQITENQVIKFNAEDIG